MASTFKQIMVSITLFFGTILQSPICFGKNTEIHLKGDVEIKISPETLEAKMISKLGETTLSQAQNRIAIKIEINGQEQASFIRGEIKYNIFLDKTGLTIKITNQKNQPNNVVFPDISTSDELILPTLEGVLVSPGNKLWFGYMGNRKLKLVEAFSFPSWGVSSSKSTISYLLNDPLETEVNFKNIRGKSSMSVTNIFPKNDLKREVELFISWNDHSVMAPAKVYRSKFLDSKNLLSEKIKSNHEAKKILGAFHFYVWGGQLLEQDNILNWVSFSKTLSSSKPGSFISTIFKDLSPSVVKNIDLVLKKKRSPFKYIRREILNAVSNAIFNQIEAIKTSKGANNIALQIQAKRRSFYDAFPKGTLEDPKEWGNGASTWIINRLKNAKIDRAWFGHNDYIEGRNHIEFIDEAKRNGYLVGSYDSYHSMHDPKNTLWPTANLGAEAFKNGRIINEFGIPSKGFLGKGFHVNSRYIRTFFEQRTNAQISIGFNSWFIDCDGAGELFSNYGIKKPMRQRDDLNERLDRLKWLENKHQIVVGTEGARSYIIPSAHFAHGTLTPPFTYSFKNVFQDKKSPNYVGNWYPDDDPQVMFKEVQLPEEQKTLFYDPRYQIPLFERAFHDQIISTHHWEIGTLKFKNVREENILREILYGIPPLFHLNRNEWKNNGHIISAYYLAVGDFLRAIADKALVDFQYQTDDRLIQSTKFDNGSEVIANFSMHPYKFKRQQIVMTIPPKSAALITGSTVKIVESARILAKYTSNK